MNKEYQEDTDSTQVTGLGKALKQGRENKNFSISRVADGLHLRPSIVTSIEDENYDLLPGDLFLKGYIRSYARLVGLDEEKMINLLDQRLSDQANEQTVKNQALIKEKRKKHSKHAVLVIVVVSIIGAAFYMWSQRLGDANLGSIETTSESFADAPVLDPVFVETEEVETQDFSDASVLAEDNLGIDKTETQLDEDSEVKEPVNNVVNELKQKPSVDETSSVSISSESVVSSEPVVENNIEIKSDPLPLVELTQEEVQPNIDAEQESEDLSPPVMESELLSTDASPDIGQVRVIFSGDCWFTLENGEGKTIYADLKRAGDEINYSGPAPFKLVIGAVSEVSVFFEQELIDFSTVRVRNNRAELELTH